jgi:hypothetical protein
VADIELAGRGRGESSPVIARQEVADGRDIEGSSPWTFERGVG